VTVLHATEPLTVKRDTVSGMYAVVDADGIRWASALAEADAERALARIRRDRIVPLIAEAIDASIGAWQRGEMTSPSEMDYVLDGDRILTAELPGYAGSTDEGREFLADEVYEDAGRRWVTSAALAAHIYDTLTAA